MDKRIVPVVRKCGAECKQGFEPVKVFVAEWKRRLGESRGDLRDAEASAQATSSVSREREKRSGLE